MRGYLVSLGYNTWKAMETKYVLQENGLNIPNEIQAYEENEKARYALFNALSKIKLTKVISLNIVHEVWQKLKDIYEGNERVKLTKRLKTKRRYKNLRLEGEDIVSYFEKFYTTVNEIRELRGTLSDEDVIDKILMTLPVSYNDKNSMIEETYDPKKFNKEQLFGSLTAFKVRIFGKDKDKSETAFKAFEDSLNDEESLDEVEENFMRKLKKGTDKYKDDESNYEDSDCLFLVENDIPKFDISKIVANIFHARRDKNEWLIDNMCESGYNVVFQDNGCEVQKESEMIITAGRRTNGNMYQLKGATKHYLISQLDDDWLWH
ncbi:uncharacterized protein LOC131858901 [Cryptomeria japonica]|uniref:uncharacterized protein LOC131858901 n=1 Tax=Cryptomeria japonica TaxID=3369 RepID=UPI0027DA606C|nr:uncharacterized protein LOC131858901 [Cryptomeria japonica]